MTVSCGLVECAVRPLVGDLASRGPKIDALASRPREREGDWRFDLLDLSSR